jgi:cytochrome c oxidase subunit 2
VSASARARSLPIAASCCAALGGCGGRQSALQPKSDQARAIADLWWWMLVAATVVMLGAVLLLAIGWARRRTEGLPVLGKSERASVGLVIAFGIVVPIVSLIALFVVANLSVAQKTNAPAKGSTAMTVEVVARQWFWEIHYPGSAAVTANEIHIPARTRVNLVARTADVIHSFWVPELNRKIDTIPGRTNRILLYADAPGRYRGQCAEFCGLQHAHMGFLVLADPPARFRAWLADQARDRRAPMAAEARSGERVFLDQACSSCHTIRGTSARGRIGPDLTHLASRSTLAGDEIPNDPAHLRTWVLDPQHVKPGNKMPGLDLSGPQARALLDYLGGLR